MIPHQFKRLIANYGVEIYIYLNNRIPFSLTMIFENNIIIDFREINFIMNQ